MKAKTGKLNQGVEAAFIGLVCLEGDQCHKGRGRFGRQAAVDPKAHRRQGDRHGESEGWDGALGHPRRSLPSFTLEISQMDGEPAN